MFKKRVIFYRSQNNKSLKKNTYEISKLRDPNRLVKDSILFYELPPFLSGFLIVYP